MTAKTAKKDGSAKPVWIGFNIVRKDFSDGVASFSVIGDGMCFTQLVSVDDMISLYQRLEAVFGEEIRGHRREKAKRAEHRTLSNWDTWRPDDDEEGEA